MNLLVKFSTLQEYGVDKPFFLENDNVDASQRNVVFLVRGEKAKTVVKVAGMYGFFSTTSGHFKIDPATCIQGQRPTGLTLHRPD